MESKILNRKKIKIFLKLCLNVHLTFIQTSYYGKNIVFLYFKTLKRSTLNFITVQHLLRPTGKSYFTIFWYTKKTFYKSEIHWTHIVNETLLFKLIFFFTNYKFRQFLIVILKLLPMQQCQSTIFKEKRLNLLNYEYRWLSVIYRSYPRG